MIRIALLIVCLLTAFLLTPVWAQVQESPVTESPGEVYDGATASLFASDLAPGFVTSRWEERESDLFWVHAATFHHVDPVDFRGPFTVSNLVFTSKVAGHPIEASRVDGLANLADPGGRTAPREFPFVSLGPDSRWFRAQTASGNVLAEQFTVTFRVGDHAALVMLLTRPDRATQADLLELARVVRDRLVG